jgi:hypothetical protein
MILKVGYDDKSRLGVNFGYCTIPPLCLFYRSAGARCNSTSFPYPYFVHFFTSLKKVKGGGLAPPRPIIILNACFDCYRSRLGTTQSGLQRLNVGSLQALGAADNLEFNGLPLIQRAIAVRLNRGKMDENVLSALALDESKALTGIKPLHCTLFFHRCVPSIL